MSDERFEKSKSDITDYRIYDYEKEDAYFIDCDDEHTVDAIVNLLNNLHQENEKKDRIIKGQDAEISRLYNLSMAMSGILREEFGVYDVFDRTKDKKTN